jgi:DNA polymerase family A/3'-5' exonuclease
VLTVDFETYYDKEYSLSKITTEAYIRDLRFEVIGVSVQRDEEEPVWFSGTKEEVAAFLASYEMHNEYVIAHHAAFDGAILAWHFGIYPKYYIDTLSMARPVVGATVGGSLAKLAKKFMLGEKGDEVVNAMGKRRKDFNGGDLFKYGEYCKNDTSLTYRLYRVLQQFVPKKEMFIIDMTIRMFTDPVLEVDGPALGQHLDKVRAAKLALLHEAKLHNNLDKAQLMSNQKFAGLLEELGVEVPMKPSPTAAARGETVMTYAFSKSDEGFRELLEHEDIRVQTLASARVGVKSTLEETRTESLIGVSKRGKLPIMLNYYGAHTGRESGGDGMNLQNLPRGGALRHALLAPAGHLLVSSDSSQIEARVVAWLAGQDDLVEDFRNGVDIYSKFASDVFQRPVDRKRKIVGLDGAIIFPDKIEGFIGKTSILGLGYGMGPDKFKATLKTGAGGVSHDMPLVQAQGVVALYRNKYDRIKALWKDGDRALFAMARGENYEFGVGIKLLCTPDGVHLPNGLMLKYTNLRKTKDGFQYDGKYGTKYTYGGKFVENVVQALARIVVFDQGASIEHRFRTMDVRNQNIRYRVVLKVHDEVVACVPEDAAKAAKQLMEATMSTPPKWAPTLPVACEADIGISYGACG